MQAPAPKNGPIEGEVYHPPAELVQSAHVQEYEDLYQHSISDPQAFWGSAPPS